MRLLPIRSIKIRSIFYFLQSILIRLQNCIFSTNHKEVIHLASVVDDTYFSFLYALINSVKRRTSNKIIFSVLDLGMSLDNYSKLKGLESDEVKINIVYRQDCICDGYEQVIANLLPHYYRIFLPYLLDNITSKFIYLDCDMVAVYDLKHLWKVPLEGFAIAAVTDCMHPTIKEGFQKYKQFGLDGTKLYFNSGLLVVDIKKWKKLDVTRKILNITVEHGNLRYPDQDALNAVFNNQWKKLNQNWNLHPDFYPSVPFIIHYLQPTKPTSERYIGRKKKEFLLALGGSCN